MRPHPGQAVKRKHRQFPSWIEQMEALAEQLAMAEERAERESAYFASMMDEVAKAAKMSDDNVSAICKRVGLRTKPPTKRTKRRR